MHRRAGRGDGRDLAALRGRGRVCECGGVEVAALVFLGQEFQWCVVGAGCT
jgi:hypothetical protein